MGKYKNFISFYEHMVSARAYSASTIMVDSALPSANMMIFDSVPANKSINSK